MPQAPPTTLIYDIAADLLATAVDVLNDNNLYVPGHRFVSWQAPAWDCCDHLVTYSTLTQPARPMRGQPEIGMRIAVLEAEFFLTYVGCTAIGDPIPSDAAMDANAHDMYEVAWTLYNQLICSWHPAPLDDAYGDGCHIVRAGIAQNRVPIGGCESVTMSFTPQFS